jgi:transposase InsO family protein
MPWKEVSTMSLRKAFVELAEQDHMNLSELCRQFGISRKTGYKWLKRYREGGEIGLADRSRRPHSSPKRTCGAMEAAILGVREDHPTWSGYKIKASLKRKGWEGLPAHSTITQILRRHGKIDPDESPKHRALQRFEMEQPNQLWQMDFKGHFAIDAGRCHPLTVLDDHSRFLLGLRACPNETHQTVQEQLSDIFRQYGLPERMLMDNGSPWGDDRSNPYTAFSAWLIRLGVQVSHGRPFHPQTQGKDERLHRTLDDELLKQLPLQSLLDCQKHFDHWRQMYNHERPHQAIGMAVPAERYQPSPRPFPEQLPPILYDPADSVRKVDSSGKISFAGRPFRVGKAFRHYPVALRPADVDGDYEVYFCHQPIARISLREDNC